MSDLLELEKESPQTKYWEQCEATQKRKHTPGPWLVKPIDSGGINEYFQIVKDGECIATIINASQAGQTKADARLIATAPKLLEAAIAQEEAEDFNANDCPDCSDDNGTELSELCEHCFPYFDKARLLRRAAVAEAIGEQ